jgi:hypothetical protein
MYVVKVIDVNSTQLACFTKKSARLALMRELRKVLAQLKALDK